MAVIGSIIKPILKLGRKVGSKIWGATKAVGGFLGKGLSKGFNFVKKGFGKVAGLLGVGSSLLNFGKKNEKDNDEAIRDIAGSKEEVKSSNSVKAETNKLKKKTGSKPQADPDALQDKRAADAERTASNEKVERIKADIRQMEELTGRAATIVRKYGSHAAAKMAQQTSYKPSAANMAGRAAENVLLGEQIRLMYDQKINNSKNIYNILGMLGANNDLLGILTEQAKLIHRQGLTDANYEVMKAEVMGSLAERAIAESKSANHVFNENETMEGMLAELVASQKQGNEQQAKSVSPLLKKTGMGIIGGLAGLAGLILASRVGDTSSDKEPEDKKDADTKTDREALKDDDTSGGSGGWDAGDKSDDEGADTEMTDDEKLEQARNEGVATFATSTAVNGYEAVKRIKSARQVAGAAKTATTAAGAAGKVAGAAARKKFINSLGPRALKVIGAKIGAKLAYKAAAKGALKKFPVIGLGFSLLEAIPRLKKGDYTGAALALGSGAASLLHLADVFTGPGGSIAAFGLGALADGALAMHDYNQAMEDLKTKGHSDLLDDDDLADILVTPTEEEMKGAEEAEKRVKEEQAEKDKMASQTQNGGDASMSPDGYDAADSGAGAMTASAPADAKKAAETLKSLDGGKKAAQPKAAETGDSALMKGIKGVGSFLWNMTPFGVLQNAMNMFSQSSGRSEVGHDTSGNWAGFGANPNATEGDVGSMNVSPEALDRIQNFGNYNINELDESGKYADDTRSMINGVSSMQGSIVYSQEQRDIDNKIGDCSAFAKWVLKKYYGVDIGGYSEAQLLEDKGRIVDYSGIDTAGTSKGRKPNLSALKPGDLVFYSSRKQKGRRAFGTGHVEVYIGNGKTIGMNTYKDGTQIFNSEGKAIGPWIHDINDPYLGNYIAAKRYVGQTAETIDYAVEGSQVPEVSSYQSNDTQTSTNSVSFQNGGGSVSNPQWSSASQTAVETPTATPAPAPHPSSGGSGSQGRSGSASGGTSGSAGGGSFNVDNSTRRGGDCIINNNTTTNIYYNNDDRGSAETR